MPRRRDEKPRVLGPTWLESRQRFRVTTLDPGAAEAASRKRDRYFADEEEAKDYRDLKEQELVRLAGTTIGQALEEYREHLRERGNKEESDESTMDWLAMFFHPVTKMQVARLRPERAAELYVKFREGRSVDYHRAVLSRAKSFLSWCIDRGLSAESPLAKVKGIGRKNKGKLQFTGDECKKWLALLLTKAALRDSASAVRHSDAAIALMMLLLMALRQSDVLRRRVRDVDLNATVLRVERGKTKKSNRPRLIPTVLRPFLKALTADMPSGELLFGERTINWLIKAQRRFCKMAGVPYVTPHGLKGTAATLAAEMGDSADRIAEHLSHESSVITERHYVDGGLIASAQAGRVMEVLFPVPNPVPDGVTNDRSIEKN